MSHDLQKTLAGADLPPPKAHTHLDTDRGSLATLDADIISGPRLLGAGSGGKIAEGMIVVLRCSQDELAAELGTTRSTLNRALHGFEDLRLIAIEDNRITLRKPESLRFYTS